MTKHRTITGFVAVALLATAATVATMRSPSTNRPTVSAGVGSLKVLAADENKLEATELERPPVVTKKAVKYEAIIENWKRHRSAAKSKE